MKIRHRLLALPTATAIFLGNQLAFGWQVAKQGCTQTDGPGITNLVCLNIEKGARTRVDQAAAIFDVVGGPKMVCNIRFKLFGRVAGQKWERFRTAKCGLNRVWARFNPATNFDRNSKLCVAVYEGGHWHPQYGCMNIY
jgi:hypothetical protein